MGNVRQGLEKFYHYCEQFQNNDKQAIDALAQRPVRRPHLLTFVTISLIHN
jgi:hypothetical protein